jgi:hypothetical protein
LARPLTDLAKKDGQEKNDEVAERERETACEENSLIGNQVRRAGIVIKESFLL